MSEAFSESSAVVKESKLKKYAERDPKRFCLIDLSAENVVGIGDDGPSLTSGATIELMDGSDVRVLIRPDLDPKMAARLLRWAGDSVEQDPDQIDTWRGIHELKPKKVDLSLANKLSDALMTQHFPASIHQLAERSLVDKNPALMLAASAAIDVWVEESGDPPIPF